MARSTKIILSLPPRFSPELLSQDWLHTALGAYHVHSYTFCDLQVRRLGDVAVVSSIYSQQADGGGIDRNTEFFITDAWSRQGEPWKVAARYSSKVEASSAARGRDSGPYIA